MDKKRIVNRKQRKIEENYMISNIMTLSTKIINIPWSKICKKITKLNIKINLWKKKKSSLKIIISIPYLETYLLTSFL